MKITVRPQPRIKVNIGGAESVGVGIPPTQVIAQNLYPDYSGAMSITPSAERQILGTSDSIVRGDIVVEAIPSNWGKIEFDGSRIRIV